MRCGKPRPVALTRIGGSGRLQNRVRNEKYPADGPADAGAGHALGTGCAWLWSCGDAGRPVVRRYLWRDLRSDNYRSDTTFAVRASGERSPDPSLA